VGATHSSSTTMGSVTGLDKDWLQREAAFYFLEQLVERHGEILPYAELQSGFEFDGQRVGLVSMRGIWKPAAMELPISIRTGIKDPYGDDAGPDGLLHYRYFQRDPNHSDNVGLRRCFEQGRPIIYFRAVEAGQYQTLWPMVIVNDDPGTLTFTVACEDVKALRPGLRPDVVDDARRSYVTRMAMTRLHQSKFSFKVLAAYQESCAVCSIKHRALLDAAHILPDGHKRGDPIVPNGMALCKIHHAAFDSNILGIRPDRSDTGIVEIRADILKERDGPMLRYGLQELHKKPLRVVPEKRSLRPDASRLEERYKEFRAAS